MKRKLELNLINIGNTEFPLSIEVKYLGATFAKKALQACKIIQGKKKGGMYSQKIGPGFNFKKNFRSGWVGIESKDSFFRAGPNV